MIALETITRAHINLFKQVRLHALQEAPYAFGSTYARESLFTDADWMQRIRRWNGELGIGYLAMDEGKACGIAGCLLDQEDTTHAQLVSMWTAPSHRQLGVGKLLVEAVLVWAHSKDVPELHLMVTSNNDSAIVFYERLGFVRTGRTEPFPNDPATTEYEMSRPTLVVKEQI
jgi:ribosomal protein S18 acetylase RimI-like enzyme